MDQLNVLLDDRLAGRVIRERRTLHFVYDDDYRSGAAPTPVSLSMPIETAEHSADAVGHWLAGLLPANTAVLDNWARTFEVANEPFSLLGTQIGEDCAGAVRFVTDERLPAAMARSGGVEWLTEASVARRVRTLASDEAAWLGADFGGRFTLGGTRAKTALLHEADRWGLPGGGASTSHVLYPITVATENGSLNEHVCLRAAHAAGLLTANTWIHSFGDQYAIIAERYDRLAQPSGWLTRIHQESLGQALNGADPTPTDVVNLLHRALPGSAADAEVLRFCDALVFNWLIGGVDTYPSQCSLLLSGNQVRLAPVRGFVCALTPSYAPLRPLSLPLPREFVVERATSLMDTLPDAFADAARDPSVVALNSTMPSRFVDSVARHVESARSSLG